MYPGHILSNLLQVEFDAYLYVRYWIIRRSVIRDYDISVIDLIAHQAHEDRYQLAAEGAI